MKDKLLKPGTKVRLWPEDTYAKYAVVREISQYWVLFEITGVEPGEPFYKPGHKVKMPWSNIYLKG